MMDEPDENGMIRFDIYTDTVDIRDYPPVVISEGIPALPGETWPAYCARAAQLLSSAA